MTGHRLALAGVVLLVTIGVGLADAQTPTTTESPAAPATTESPTATTVAAAPTGPPAPATRVADGEEYLAALAAASADPTGPHTIEITDHFDLASGADPTYTGTQPLTVIGNDFAHEMGGMNRFLVVTSNATVTLQDVWAFDGDAGSGDGGAVLYQGTGTLEVVSSTFDSNRAGGDGGAIASPQGTVFLTRSLLSSNRATRGGGLAAGNGGVASTTVAWNHADQGGGIFVTDGAGDIAVIHATVAENHAPAGANVSAERDHAMNLVATALVAPMGGGTNCDLPAPSGGQWSFADDDSCGLGPTSTVEVDGPDPLGPLTGSDAFEVNMQPNPGSLLIDAIPPVTPYSGPQVTCLTFPDQRGLARPQEGDGVEPAWCDIGAVEVDWFPPDGPTRPTGPVGGRPGYTG